MAAKCPKCDFDNTSDSKFCKECGTQLFSTLDKSVSYTKTLETPILELTRGTTFAGRYELIEEIGKGGMGRVYKVFDLETKEKIALKVLKPEIAVDRATIERFRNELKYARKIAHKNVCRMYDLGKESGHYYITMEFVSGEDLKSIIRMVGQLGVGKAVSITKQVCEGLIEAHRLGVVHRDLKPQNIMIDREGNVRIMDFGIARSLQTKGITDQGIIIGTPEYMSPEQVEGKEVDPRSDIYSLGVILYEMLTGRVPFEGDTPLSIALKQTIDVPPDPRRFNDQIPGDLSLIILKCMEKAPGRRYQSAELFLNELNKIEKEKHETAKTDQMKWGRSIAVLPFTDLSPGKDQDYFCEGITEELINALTKVENLKVASGSSAFQFKGKGHDIHEIGEKLKVQTVLEGSVRKAGNRLRITAELINVADGYHIWSEKYDCEMKDIFAIQDEIALTIADKLKVRLLSEEREGLVKRHTENIEAYNLYLKGRYFWSKRTQESFRRAIEFFEQAIAEDPSFGLAYSGLADTFNLFGFYSVLAGKEAFPKAKQAALKALEIDSSIAEAYTSLAFAQLYYDWDWEGARQNFKRAIEHGPGYATAHHWYAEYLVLVGRMEEAIAEGKQALEFDPFSLVINTLFGWPFHYSGRYDQAIERYHRTLELDPNFMTPHFFLGLTFVEKAMYEEAITEFNRAKVLFGDSALMEAAIGHAYARWGKKAEVQKILAELEQISKQRHVPFYFLAAIHADFGDRDQAFHWLEKCFEERDMWLAFLKVDPIWNNLRSDPRFVEILNKMGLIN
jgi:serine/threonine protein kinase/tetratricopeptide (TPR) repeat protein